MGSLDQGSLGAPVFNLAVTWGGPIKPCQFIGIYVGRYTADGREGLRWDLGRAFKPRIITEIFKAHDIS
jgi:hypothetical protein